MSHPYVTNNLKSGLAMQTTNIRHRMQFRDYCFSSIRVDFNRLRNEKLSIAKYFKTIFLIALPDLFHFNKKQSYS